MENQESDALIIIAHSEINNLALANPSLNKEALYQAIDEYIAGKIDFAQCKKVFKRIANNEAPVIKVNCILSVENVAPIQYYPKDIFRSMRTGRKAIQSWTPNEDKRLLFAMHKFGRDAWQQISEFVGNNRTKAQCSQRWTRVLDPRICKGPWTKEEEDKLFKLVEIYGTKKWKHIAAQFDNRTDTQCRYHYNMTCGKNKDYSSDEKNSYYESPRRQTSSSPKPKELSKEESEEQPEPEETVINVPEKQKQETTTTKQNNDNVAFLPVFDTTPIDPDYSWYPFFEAAFSGQANIFEGF